MKLKWEDVRGLKLDALQQELLKAIRPASDVTIEDLVAPSPELSTGLYVFWFPERKAEAAYVGMAGSRAIIEEVSAHFDMREEAYFGILLVRLAEQAGVRKRDMVQEVLKMRLSVVFCNIEKDWLKDAEDALIAMLKPKHNAPPKAKVSVDGQTLEQVAAGFALTRRTSGPL